MDNIIGNNGEVQFANGQSSRDLRVGSDANESETQLHVRDLFEPTPSSDPLEALRRDSDEVLERRIELPDGPGGESSISGGSPRYRRITKRVVLLALLFLAVGALSPFAWNYLQSYESTDDAQIDGHIDPLSSRINGTVIRVHAEDDDRVKAGELLVEIDPRDYQVAVENAAANLAMVEQVVKAAQQNYDLSAANLAAAVATNNKAQMDVKRYRELLDQGVIARETNDQIVMTGKVDAAAVNSDSAAQAAAARVIGQAEAAVQAAQASLDQARLNLSYTKIYAPANGIVGRRTVELGSRIEPGQTLMFVTETDEIWVTADFKETQLARMHRGERVSVHVDTFGRDYRGYVRNLPGASGDRFSLLPAENATGNYVKVVQRLPVRIEFDPGQDPDHLLHPGMSVEPKVWLR
ncbi:MAG: HlyD family secretion protein [Candidatus Binatus sp.]|jgi:membrane fusion protein (multidrug efflux system)|uniref:efflux RND transporter periplasmic adaptor subunit n=1 Tax=Candidatus Binatus sp. TaxID=2811406 RepID=UPI003C7151FC